MQLRKLILSCIRSLSSYFVWTGNLMLTLKYDVILVLLAAAIFAGWIALARHDSAVYARGIAAEHARQTRAVVALNTRIGDLNAALAQERSKVVADREPVEAQIIETVREVIVPSTCSPSTAIPASSLMALGKLK